MKKYLFIFLFCLFSEAKAQVRVNLSVASPPFWEINNMGKSSHQYSSSRDALSPGIELDNLFAKEKNGGKLHYTVGFYYTNPTFVSVFKDDDDNAFFSEIKTQAIHMPVMARASFPVSELIENNRMGMELGFIASNWFRYDLQEAASIKTLDAFGNIIGETNYYDHRNLASGFGQKVNLKVAGGFFIYVNRFYFSWRMDLLSLGNMYTDLNFNTWNVPAGYSLYNKARSDGRMKYAYSTLNISFRISKK